MIQDYTRAHDVGGAGWSCCSQSGEEAILLGNEKKTNKPTKRTNRRKHTNRRNGPSQTFELYRIFFLLYIYNDKYKQKSWWRP